MPKSSDQGIDPLFKNSLANVQLSENKEGVSILWSKLAEVSVLARDLLLTNTVGGSLLVCWAAVRGRLD
jgi:hypothetical protein